MSAQNHTPGPWVARRIGNPGLSGRYGYAIDFNEDQGQVADFVYEEADAKLIAAAPDLLRELIMLRDTIPHAGIEASIRTEMLRRINDAIAKATA